MREWLRSEPSRSPGLLKAEVDLEEREKERARESGEEVKEDVRQLKYAEPK